MNVNKKTIAILTGTVILPMTAVGCSGGSDKTYSYEVSGVVEAAQVDYECKGDLDLEPASFTAGRTKPEPKKAESDDSSSDSDFGDSEKKKPAKKDVAASKAPASKAPSKSGGVKLSKKPDKPERVTKIKPPKCKHKGCHEEYELFVKNREGLFEQDVRKVDYDNCLDKAREHFPACTKN